MSYTIVKHAQKDVWEYHFDTDPTKGVHVSHSAAFTHSGKCADLEVEYEDLQEANEACHRINEQNPCGNYAVCIVIPE
jgi:hypothetical protein